MLEIFCYCCWDVIIGKRLNKQREFFRSTNVNGGERAIWHWRRLYKFLYFFLFIQGKHPANFSSWVSLIAFTHNAVSCNVNQAQPSHNTNNIESLLPFPLKIEITTKVLMRKRDFLNESFYKAYSSGPHDLWIHPSKHPKTRNIWINF